MASAKATENNLAYIITYVLTWITGIVIYLTLGQEDSRLKFHAVQAIFLGFVIWIIWYVGGFLPLSGVIRIIALLLWLYGLWLGWQGSKGRDIAAPFIGRYAREYSK